MNKIINVLKSKKNLSVEKFINIALYDKEFGYYMKRNPFGEEGDFITSPLISKLFSEMIAVWCIAFWEHLKKPKKIFIVELGPGDASLCSDLLDSFKKFENFYKSLEIRLLEKSPKLREKQKENVKNKKVKWINSIEEINSGPIIFLGNEFFDSLPIKQFCKKKDTLFERHVTLTKDKKKLKFFYKKANKKIVKNLTDPNLIKYSKFLEYPSVAIKYLKKITKKINKYDGALLSFDYGYTKNKIHNYTLQSVNKHKYSNIFTDPGNSDITHLVNYELFLNILKKNGLKINKVVTQNHFLQRLGIMKRADILSKKITFKEKINMFYRLKRLLHHEEMGSLFKVLLALKKNNNFSLGFK